MQLATTPMHKQLRTGILIISTSSLRSGSTNNYVHWHVLVLYVVCTIWKLKVEPGGKASLVVSLHVVGIHKVFLDGKYSCSV